MNCDSARTEIIAYLKNELEAGKRKRLEEHFAKCPDCRKELDNARNLLEWTEAASDDGVVRLVDQIFKDAISSGASDIHFESQKDNTLLVRHRIDGVLREVSQIPEVTHRGVVSRVKMLADMNVAETRVPQDGRIPIRIDDKNYDLRVNCIPYIYGEGIVIRILDRSSVLVGMDKLGFYPEHTQTVENMIGQPNGMIIVSGPTGSGKTTTLYSMMMKLVSPDRKLMSIEDPVEYALPGVNQVQVNTRAGLTFTGALRAFLRQDPDIIMVGETRDPETGKIAIEAAVTGHLVLTQLCTNDAPGAITRLLDMGLESFLVSATLLGIVSQRLARMVCSDCGEDVNADPDDPAIRFLGITDWDLKEHKIKRGKGCETCRHTGYRGRTGVYEILVIDPELRALISNGVSGSELAEAARARGFLDMRADAKRKVLDGIIPPEEALRILA